MSAVPYSHMSLLPLIIADSSMITETGLISYPRNGDDGCMGGWGGAWLDGH